MWVRYGAFAFSLTSHASTFIWSSEEHPSELQSHCVTSYAVVCLKKKKKLLEEAGLPNIRFHDLRHTFATHALAGGVDAKTLSGILGHTKASFTLDTYAHVTGDMQRHAAGIVGDFIQDIL